MLGHIAHPLDDIQSYVFVFIGKMNIGWRQCKLDYLYKALSFKGNLVSWIYKFTFTPWTRVCPRAGLWVWLRLSLECIWYGQSARGSSPLTAFTPKEVATNSSQILSSKCQDAWAQRLSPRFRTKLRNLLKVVTLDQFIDENISACSNKMPLLWMCLLSQNCAEQDMGIVVQQVWFACGSMLAVGGRVLESWKP